MNQALDQKAKVRPWAYATAGFAVLALIALLLVWGGGPMMPGGSGGSAYSHWYWDLPFEVSRAALLVLLVSPVAALVCAVVAIHKRYPNLPGGVWLTGLVGLVFFLLMVIG